MAKSATETWGYQLVDLLPDHGFGSIRCGLWNRERSPHCGNQVEVALVWSVGREDGSIGKVRRVCCRSCGERMLAKVLGEKPARFGSASQG